MTRAAEFSVERIQVLDREGNLVDDTPEIVGNRERLVAMYRWMVLTRTFDARAVSLQRTGQLGTYASSLGQEAVSVGLAAAMEEADVLLPSFREHGAQLCRGVTMTELLLFWGGDERGSDFSSARHDFPCCIPVGSHAPHAAGVAMAIQLRGESRAAVCVFGDGATSKGDVYEAMNISGAWSLPVVFVACNNEWAISVPRTAQTACETLAQKALASGFEGLQVDGNDVIAVREVAIRALEKARRGGGPTFIEAQTYRLGDHTTVDDASRYRDDEEVGRHWEQEPVARLRDFLTRAHGWSREEEETIIETCRNSVEASVEEYLAMDIQPVESIFDYLHGALPSAYAGQRSAALEADAEK